MTRRSKRATRVIVTTGRDKGKKGEVIKVFPKENRALVSGINVVKRHQRQTATEQGGIVNKEAADPSFQSRACRSEVGRRDAHRFQDSGRRPQGSRRQEVG